MPSKFGGVPVEEETNPPQPASQFGGVPVLAEETQPQSQFGGVPVLAQAAVPEEELPAPQPPVPETSSIPSTSGILNSLITEGYKAYKGSTASLASAPERVDLAFDAFTVQKQNEILDIYKAIDEGADPRELYEAANAKEKTFGPVELGQFINYQKADQAKRANIREQTTGAVEEAREDFLKTLPEIQRRSEEAEQFAPRVGSIVETVTGLPERGVIKTLADARDWLAYNVVAGGVQLAPVMAAGAVAGPTGALTVGTTLAGAETIENRLAYIQQVVQDLPPEDQATAIAEYLYKTNDTNTMVAIVSGALDLAGPVGSILKRQLTKEISGEVLERTAGEAAREALQQAPREILEEGLTGGAQEIAQIAGQRATGEQVGNVLSKENITRVLDAAAAEAVGSISGTAINTATAAGSQALTNRTIRKTEEEISKQLVAERARANAGDTAQLIEERVAQYMSEDANLTEQEAFDRAIDDVATGNVLEPAPDEAQTLEIPEETKAEVTQVAELVVKESLGDNEVSQYKSYVEETYGPAAGQLFDIEVKRLNAAPVIVETKQEAADAVETEVKDTDSAIVKEVQNDLSPETAGQVIDEAAVKVEEGQSVGEAISTATEEVIGDNTELEAAVAEDGLPESTEVLKNTGKVQTNPETGLGPKGKRGRPPVAKTPEQIKFAEEARKETKKASVNNKRAMDRGQKAWDANYEDAAFKRAKITREEYEADQQELADLREIDKYGVNPALVKKQNNLVKRINRVEDALRTEQANSQAARQESLINALKILKDPRYKDRKPATGKEKKAVWQRAEELLNRADVTDADRARAREALEREEAQGTVAKSMPLLDSTNTEPNPVLQEEGITLKAALDSILKNGNPFEKLLIRRLRPFLENINLVVVRDTRALPAKIQGEFLTNPRGVYASEFNTIYLALDGTDNTTLLHEAVHAATVDIVDTWLSDRDVPGMAEEQIEELMLELQAQMDAAAQHYAEEKALGRVSEDIEYLVEEVNVLTDIKEFLAYGITQPEMQEFLAGVEAIYVAKKNFIENGLTKFINSIAKLFGFKGEQALNGFTSLMDLTDRLLLQLEVSKRPSTSSINQARARKKKVTRTAKKLARSRSASDFAQNMAELAAASFRGETEAIDLLKALKNTLSRKQKRIMSQIFTTTGLSRLLESMYVGNVKKVNQAVVKMGVMRANRIKDLAQKIPFWDKFNHKFQEGAAILADVMHMATLLNFDPSKHATLNDALQNDAQIKELRKARQAALQNPNLTPGAVNAAKAAVTRRENEIKEVWNGTEIDGTLFGGWSRLQEEANGGQQGVEIYKTAKEAYQKTFQEHQNLLLEKIEASTLPEDKKKTLLASIVSGFQEAKKLEVYFPLMRYGHYYLRVGSGQDRQFYLFESELARDTFAEKIAREQLNKDLDQAKADQDISMGNNLEDGLVNKDITESSQLLKGVFDLLDGAAVADIDVIKDQVYQMYLMTLPESDIRKRFAHRKGVAGFNTDALRNFIVSQTTSANQLARLKYSGELRNAIAASYAELVGRPDADDAKIYLDELRRRALEESNPNSQTGNWDTIARLGNKFVFYWLLSAPKSAIIQLTQLPIVGLPILAAKYGLGATVGIATRYATGILGAGVLGRPKLGIKRTYTDEDGNVQVEWAMPNILSSSYIQDEPDPEKKASLERAWNYAAERDLFMSTYAADMTSRGQLSSKRYTSPVSKVARGIAGMMGGLFHHTERINREIMYMSSFELAYNEAKKKGLSNEAAQREAQERAVELTYEGLFNYTNYNKPTFMKSSAAGRIATQFMSFSLMMTSYIYRNMYEGFIKSIPSEQEYALSYINAARQLDDQRGETELRAEATQRRKELVAERREGMVQFTGTMGMTFMFAGATGVLNFSLMMGVIDGIIAALRPDYEDADEDEKEFWYGDPLSPLHPSMNTELWFRAVWIPRTFGPDSDLAAALGLSEEAANVLARGVELGPISAFTNGNVGASTKLDGLWFRDDSREDDLESAFVNFTYNAALGPFGSLARNAARAYEDFQNGEYQRGFENLLPAFFRNPVEAIRLNREGLVTRGGNPVKPAEFYTANRLLGEALGFGNTEVAQIQDRNFLIKDAEVTATRRRQELLEDLDRAVRNLQESDYSDNAYKRIDEVYKEIQQFNTEYPWIELTDETLDKSIDTRADRRGSSVQGYNVPPNLEEYIFPLLDPSLQPKRN